MCLFIKVLASLASESGISFFGVRGEGGGGQAGLVGRWETKHFIGMAFSTVVTQDLLATIFSSDNTRGNLFGGNLF